MIGALETVAELCALGLGLGRNDITSLMHEGPHLLAPTGEPDCTHKSRARALDQTDAAYRQLTRELAVVPRRVGDPLLLHTSSY